MVARVGYIEIRAGDRDVVRFVELTVPGTRDSGFAAAFADLEFRFAVAYAPSDDLEKPARGAELLDAIIMVICYPDISACVDLYSLGALQLAGFAAVTAERSDVGAAGG